ncbi:hypothetical protein [Leptospira biflexa]|uniref:hypothetical protein n=1 Tax=Leptospira biflexa TaxID=172 RepID=UPI001082F9AA|nr:hypothetical protein [Leptospira biflexa]TGM30726.1 hypothetical protein EHQ89_18095 [Leptospira biflexa]TGM34770.1 hypothetical protein EHQ80_14075 [Leptospira biflexa]
MNKINVIIKDDTLGFDIGSLLSNPAVGIGMNAILPGSSLALPFLNQAISQPKKPSGNTQLSNFLNTITKKNSAVAPPPPKGGSAIVKTSIAPPPPISQVQSFVQRQVQQTTQEPKKELDKNILLFGGIALAGLGVFILTNNKGKRR